MSNIIPLIVAGESPPTNRVAIKPNRIIKIGSVQLNSSFSDQCYFPQSLGTLQAYAKKHLAYAEYYEFLIPIYTFLPIGEAVRRLISADIAIFSVYVWNFENSLAIAKELKQLKPEVVIIFGGPHVPDSKKQFQRIKKTDPKPDELKRKRIGMTEEFHRQYPFIDMAVHGEGERIFKIILEQIAADGCQNKSDIPSISYLDANNIFHHNPKLERMHDLSEVPSSYLTGVFDALMQAHPQQKWIAMWETDRGCPYPCSYCDWGGATEDKVSAFPIDQVSREIEWFAQHKIPYIFLANANFGILKQDVQIAKKLAEVKKATGYPEGISVQNAKNPKPHTLEALEILEKAGLNKATVMSIQSKNRDTLKAVRRENMKLEEYQANQSRLRAQGVYTYTDYILGLPMETYESVVSGISEIISDGQHDRVQVNILAILPNAEMGDREYQELYGMDIIRTKIINTHGKKNDSISGVEEYQDLVIATRTMPREDWVKARAFCCMTGLIYFYKTLQIPIILLHEKYGLSYRQLLEIFVQKKFLESEEFPIFSEIYSFFIKTSRDMQAGLQEEYMHSKEWLDIYWTLEEYTFTKLVVESKLNAFYNEAERILTSYLKQNSINAEDNILEDAIKLNRALIKLPFQTEDLEMGLSHNIWEVYRAVQLGKQVIIENGRYSYIIDRTSEKWLTWEDWYQKMVWYGNRRGAYLYGNKNPHQEIAGHH